MTQSKNVGRRAFLKRSAGAAVAASSIGAALTGQANSQAAAVIQAKTPDLIIDAHLHCGGT
ncbi:MAG: twin-arginine translocation signal domain-containing protein, partial [Acidobacteriota bacterium]